MDRGARKATVHGVTKESSTTLQLNSNTYITEALSHFKDLNHFKAHSSVALSTFTLCYRRHIPPLELLHLPKEKLYPIK